MFVKLSNTDDLPELWSPTTTSYKQIYLSKSKSMSVGKLTWGSATCWPTFFSRSWSILRSKIGLARWSMVMLSWISEFRSRIELLREFRWDFKEPMYNFGYCAHTLQSPLVVLGCLHHSLSLTSLRMCFLQSRCLYVIVFLTLAETYWLTIANYCRHSGDGAHSEWKPYLSIG